MPASMLSRYLMFLFAAAAMAAPCTTPPASCLDKIAIEDGHYLGVYTSLPLTPPPAVERVFILVHGTQRNGDEYFTTAVKATQEAGALARTLVIAPVFRSNEGRSCKDELQKGELGFGCGGWKDGAPARNARTDSFAVMDKLLALADRLPDVKEIVVAGHSAGGQYVQRYAAVNRAEAKLKHPVRYVVANPSSYLYLEGWRPEAKRCESYNEYKYGLDKLFGYASATGPDTIREQFPKRDVTYLLGERDFTDEHNLDKSCEAMAQGPNRLARGLAYFERFSAAFPGRHKMLKVPACDHNADCMYRSDVAKALIFR